MSRTAVKSKSINNIDTSSEKILVKVSKRNWEGLQDDILKAKPIVTNYVTRSGELENRVETDDKIIDMLQKSLEKVKKEKDEANNKLKYYENNILNDKLKPDSDFTFFNEEEMRKMANEAKIRSKKQDDERLAFYTNLCSK